MHGLQDPGAGRGGPRPDRVRQERRRVRARPCDIGLELVARRVVQPVGVHPRQLRRIEHRTALAEAIEREQREHVGARQDVTLVAGMEPEQREVSQQRVGHIARTPPVAHRHRGLTGALAHLGAVRVEDQCDVREHRRRPTEGLVKHELARRVREVFLGAQHMGDRHGVVVDHAREVVGRQPVRAQQHEVADHAGRERDPTTDRVVELLFAIRDDEAHAVRLTRGGTRIGVGGQKGTAAAVVVRRAPGRGRGGTSRVEFGVGAEAAIGRAARPQQFGVGAVERQPLALAIGSVRAADLGSFVPHQVQPAQVVEHATLALGARAFEVGVLDPQDECAAMLTREQPVEVRGAGATDVQPTGGARGEADADGRGRSRRWLGGHGGEASRSDGAPGEGAPRPAPPVGGLLHYQCGDAPPCRMHDLRAPGQGREPGGPMDHAI